MSGSLPENLLCFLQEAEGLKSVERTAWTSSGRRESTAEHSWRLALLAWALLDRYPRLDHAKVLALCLVHDLGERDCGDRSASDLPDPAAKRREEAVPERAERPKSTAERPRERNLKFSYKEQLEFETIDDTLAELEAQLAACTAAQEACGSDYVKLQELQAQQAELEARLEEKTERWVYLNELKEKIDAQN